MSANAGNKRPLSPHLQVYRPQITSILSITHRATGVVNMFGLMVLALWLITAATSNEAFASMQWLMGSFVGIAAMIVWSWTIFYHLCNGVRHLVWDTGHGLDVAQVTRSGILVLVISSILTLVAWISAAVI